MYLIHAILVERLYESPVPYLKRIDGEDVQDEDLGRAKLAYRAWWTKWEPGGIEKKDPLEGTDLVWR